MEEQIKDTAGSGKTSARKNNESGFFIRLAYGVVGGYMDTENMTTSEVIDEFLKHNGVKTPKEFFKKKFGKKEEKKQEAPTEQEKPKSIKTTKTTKTNKKQELVDFVKQQIKIDLDTSDDAVFGKRNILYVSIPEHKELYVLNFLHKHGYSTANHIKNKYWIYLR